MTEQRESVDMQSGNEILPAAIKKDVAAERLPRFRTAAEIAAEAPVTVPWLSPPWIATGAITEVMGKPKAAGKTTWLMRLVAAVLDGKDFLGQPTDKTPVVYLTEERDATFRESLRRAGLLESPNLHVLIWRDTLEMRWPEIMDAAVGKCKEVGARLLIVDTLSQFARLSGDSENNAGPVLEAYRPLQEAAGHDLAVVAVRHERKSGGDVADAGRGSSAFTGAADIVLSIRQPDGNTRQTMREIRALSRFDETPDLLTIELTEHGYVSLGDSAAVATVEAKAAILKVAPATAAAALTLDQFVNTIEKKRTVTQDAITALVSEGPLQRLGKGVKGDPYRWFAPGIDSAETSTSIAAQRIEQPELADVLMEQR